MIVIRPFLKGSARSFYCDPFCALHFFARVWLRPCARRKSAGSEGNLGKTRFDVDSLRKMFSLITIENIQSIRRLEPKTALSEPIALSSTQTLENSPNN